MTKFKIKQRVKTPLALLISTGLFSTVQAADYIVADYDNDHYVANGSQENGDIRLGKESGFSLELLSGSMWTGNVIGPTANNRSDMANNIDINLYDGSTFNGNISGVAETYFEIISSTFNGNIDSIGRINFSAQSGQYNGEIFLHALNEERGSLNGMMSEGSEWNGNISTTNSDITLRLMASNFTGDIDAVNEDREDRGRLSARVSQGSTWHGNITATNMDISLILDNSSFIGGIDGNNTNNEITLQNGSVWTGHINNDRALSSLSLSDSRWNITGDTQLDNLYLASVSQPEKIDFTANPNTRDYTTLTVNDLEGDGHFIMRAGYFGKNDYGNDKLVILGDKNVSLLDASNHQMTVMNNGTNNTYGTEVLTMVETVDGLDSFTLTNGEVELGGYVYTLEKVGNNWVLRPGAKGSAWEPEPDTGGNGGGGPSVTEPGKSAVNKANVTYLLGYAETQTLYQRMGELRQSQSNGDVWARGYFGGFSQFSGGLLNGFKMNYNGVQIGTDAKVDVGNDSLFLGMMFGLTHAKQDYATGKGTTRGKHIGLYSSYLTENDVYIDGVLKYSYFKDEMNVRDSQAQRVTGDSDSHSVTASVEAGKRFYLNEEKAGVYVEPQVQFTYARYSKAHMDLSNGLRVNIDGYDSMLGRAGVQLGYNVVESATPVNFYFKSSYVKEFDGKTDYTLNNSKQKHSFKGDWWTNGVGVSVQAMNNHQLYLDMEHSDGNRFNQHQINAGYRFSF